MDKSVVYCEARAVRCYQYYQYYMNTLGSVMLLFELLQHNALKILSWVQIPFIVQGVKWDQRSSPTHDTD